MNKFFILKCKNISKEFRINNKKKKILHNISLTVNFGEMLAIIGKSGSGKSTLLHIISGLDNPSSGQVFINGKMLSSLSDKDTAHLRNTYLGFIYQFHHLLPDFTVLENVYIPLLINKLKKKTAKKKAKNMLEKLGLEKIIYHFPSEISGGEKQRVAVARSLINNPNLVVADEPTGNLDTENTKIVYNLFKKFNKFYKTTFIVVTHDLYLAKKLNKIMKIDNGSLFSIENK